MLANWKLIDPQQDKSHDHKVLCTNLNKWQEHDSSTPSAKVPGNHPQDWLGREEASFR